MRRSLLGFLNFAFNFISLVTDQPPLLFIIKVLLATTTTTSAGSTIPVFGIHHAIKPMVTAEGARIRYNTTVAKNLLILEQSVRNTGRHGEGTWLRTRTKKGGNLLLWVSRTKR